MAELITMPKLGFDMAEGKLVRWVKKQGESVAKGEVLAEVETDKATVEVESFAAGTVAATLAEEGSYQKVGALIAVITAPGENVDIEALKDKTIDDRRPPIQAPPSPASQPASKTNGAPLTSDRQPLTSTFLRISPIARRLTDELGIDPRQVKGTGPEGRITKKDVEAFAKSPPPSSSSVSSLRSVTSVSSVDESSLGPPC
ncbi:MAG: biotin/lipoyl-containing protein, partial [Chloroflexota bacterium]